MCYSNQAKVALAGVPAALIEAHGAVSEPVAEAMADGIRRSAATSVGVGITGIAGPGGGTESKPVGTVAIAVVADRPGKSDGSGNERRASSAHISVLRRPRAGQIPGGTGRDEHAATHAARARGRRSPGENTGCVRLFVAIALDQTTRDRVVAAQRRLVSALGTAAKSLRIVGAEQLHLTLAFVGEVEDSRAAAIASRLAVEIEQPPFTLTLGSAGVFPARGASRVLWLGVLDGLERGHGICTSSSSAPDRVRRGG